MQRIVLTAVVAVALVLAFSAVSVAQDSPETKMKQDAKEAMKVKGEKMEQMQKMEQMGKEGLMSVSCDPACGFRVTSHDQAEITSMVKDHAKNHHQKVLSDADVKGMMKPAGKMGMRTKEEMKDKVKEKKEGEDPHKH